MSERSKQRTAILVLGMHRSGTSAVTRFLNLLGAALPDQLLEAVADNNASGFWESRDIQLINDQLLEDLDSRWDDWRQLPAPDQAALSGNPQVQELAELLRAQFDGIDVCVLKDPRICRLLPWWQQVLNQAGRRVVAVLPLRHPLEVAASLQRRDGFSREKSVLLWLRHVLDAERGSRAWPRIFMPYDALLRDWRAWPQPLADGLGLQLGPVNDETAGQISTFLNPAQRHHQLDSAAVRTLTPRLADWTERTLAALAGLDRHASNDAALSALDEISAELAELEAVVSPALADDMRSQHAARASWDDQRHALEQRLDDRIARVEQLEAVALERKTRLQERAERVAELENLAAQRKQQLEERAARLQEIENLAQERKQLLQERSERIASLEQLAAQRKTALEEKAAQLSERASKVEALERLHAERRDTIAQLRNKLDSLNQAHLKLFRQSRLDKLTARQQAADARLAGQSLGWPPRQAFGQRLGLNQRRRIWRQGRKLLVSGLFDARWYLLAYPDVMGSRLHPIWHWMIVGWQEGRRPNALFDPRWYLKQCPDVDAGGLNPLIHYLEHGAAEGRHPGPLFDASWYLQRHADVATAGLPALQHYLQHGRGEGRQPLAWFDPAWYLQRHADVRDSGLDALHHYLLMGGAEQRDPGPDFAGHWYLQQHADVRASGMNPLEHYLAHGRLEGRPPRPELQTKTPAPITATPATPEPRIPRYAGARQAQDGYSNVLLCAHAANGQLFGGERSFLDILELLRQMPCNVYVVIPALNPQYIEALRPLCCEIVQIAYAYWRAGQAPDALAQRQLQAYMISRQIQLVHVNTIVVREPLLASRELGIRSIVHVRESVHDDAWISRMMGLAPEALVEHVINGADVVIANSRHTAEEFDKPGQCFVVPNTFDMAALDIPNQLAEDDRIRVGLISSNIPKKGLDDFAQLACACAQRLPQYEFLLIGPDNEHVQALKRRQQAGKLSQNLIFVGYQSSPLAAIERCNIVVNLSHFKESFGRTVAEALAARRPVIVYDQGAPQDLVQDGVSGHVIPFPDWQQALAPLQAWAEDSSRLLAMGEAGRRFISANFSRDAGVQALQKAYTAALRDAPAPLPLTRPARRQIQPATEPLRLAYFCWHFPVPSETFVLNELRLLVEAGVDVQVYCKQSPYPDFQPDFPITWSRVRDPDDLAAQLKAAQRSLVHAHFTYPTVTDMVWPACERASIPFTFIAHAQDIFKHDNDRRNRIGEITRSASCLAVFTLGRFHRDFLLERGVPAEKLIINPNGIDPTLFPFRPPSARDANAPRRVCAIHRLTEKKGLHHLIEAARLLKGEGYEINIYGYGDEEPRLQKMLQDEPLDFVRLRGPLRSRQEILAVQAEHDLFACPSVRTDSGDMDGIPTVLIEAMAAGTAVITTPVASIPDLVQDGVNGILVPPGDAAALAAGIRRFFDLDAEQVRGLLLNARAAVEERHDARKLTTRLQRFWQQITVDIVIVSWNNLAELSAVIDHLYAHTKSHFHLIICDNASEPEVTDVLFELQARHDNLTVVHRGCNSLVGPGTNTAVEQGRSDYVIYVCGKEGFALRDGWETDMIGWMDAHPRVGLAGSLGYSPSYLTGRDLATGIPLFDKFRNPDFAAHHPDRIFHHVQGGLFILRRAMYDEIGGFSEAVPHAYTDVEYSYYVESCGWELGSIPSVLALFNKTVPDIWSRIHEGVKVIHPPRLVDLPRLHAIAEQQTHFCNCCGWAGPAFGADDECPQCAAAPRHRSLYRYLAESTLTYRRLPALWVNPHASLLPFWRKSFQGRQLNQDELLREIRSQGQLDQASGGLALAVLDAPCDDVRDFDVLLGELSRSLSQDSKLILMPRPHQDPKAILNALQRQGFGIQNEVRFASHVVRYDLHAIYVMTPR